MYDLTDKSIVAIDDSPDVLRLYRHILTPRSRGPSLNLFDDAEQAYGFIDTNRPNAIITDLVVHDVNGLAYLDKALREGEWIPTVIASGSQGTPQMVRLFEDGFSTTGNRIPLALLRKSPVGFDRRLLGCLTCVLNTDKTTMWLVLKGDSMY